MKRSEIDQAVCGDRLSPAPDRPLHRRLRDLRGLLDLAFRRRHTTQGELDADLLID